MQRRDFVRNLLLGSGYICGTTLPFSFPILHAEPSSDMKITRIRYYKSPNHNPTFNQSNGIVTVETDSGLIGIGEGGTPDMIRQLGAMLIGQDPFRIEHLWQVMYRSFFYPPGREKIHGLGALDLALWDLKGKALGVPVHELLGGLTRDHIQCYSTAFPSQGDTVATARACIDAGFKAYRVSVIHPNPGEPFDPHRVIPANVEFCEQVKEGVGDGDWAIDFHTRLDMAQAVRLADEIEDLEPFFCEDLIRSENEAQYKLLRQKVDVPIAVGEHHSDRWDIHELIEQDLIDYSRVTLPNAGGITEYKKLAALCETHYVGLVPHFTGPVATAALVHACGSSSGPVLMEILRDKPREEPHLPESFDFRDGKVWPNDRPGLGVVFDPEKAEQQLEITEYALPIPTFRRPDGSVTNW